MQLSPPTSTLVDALDAFSRHKLTRKNDLGILLELALHTDRGTGSPEPRGRVLPDSAGRGTATEGSAAEALRELSFTAKFISRAYGIIRRIGPEDPGYDALRQQVAGQLERAEELGRALLQGAPVDTREYFLSTYYTRSREALERHLALLYDLSWYKNWLIDHRTE